MSMRSTERPEPPTPCAVTGNPPWTVRSVFAAGFLTIATYMLLPYLEMLSTRPEPSATVRSVGTREIPLPPPPPAKRDIAQPRPARRPPKPELRPARPHRIPLTAAMSLDVAMGDIGGDFDLGFAVEAPGMDESAGNLVFQLAELDQPPSPLVRLPPVYPPQARMRRTEGVVVLEFVVDADGKTRNIEVVMSQPGNVFTRAAVRAASRWRFQPGKKNGRPVAVRVKQKVAFQLE
jgi:periplasmic protein TonB